MLLASIILLFSLLALGLLALLDRYDTAVLKAQVQRQGVQPPKVVYYDAFADRRRLSDSSPTAGQADRRKVAA